MPASPTRADGRGGRTISGDDIAILRPEEIRQLPERQALVIAENARPIIATLTRCLDGKRGARLQADQQRLRAALISGRPALDGPESLAAQAYAEATRLGLTDEPDPGAGQPGVR